MLKFRIFLFLLIAANVCYSQSSSLQRHERRKIFSAYEIVVGGGLLKNSGYQMQYFVPKFGYSVGVGAYHTFTNSFDLNVRLTYDLKGSRAEEYSGPPPSRPPNPVTASYVIESDFHYLTITALPTFTVGIKKNILLGGGCYYSFLRKYKIQESDVLSNGQVNASSSTYKYPKLNGQSDMGICAFMGYRFKLIKTTTGTIQFFFNRSIQDVDDPIAGWQRHKSFMLMFSASLPNR